MAITKTTNVQQIMVDPAHPNDVFLCVEDSWDDPDDNTLPITKGRTITLSNGDDLSGYDQIVRDVCTGVFSSE